MCTLNRSKFLLAILNFLLLVWGGFLTAGGIILILDSERILISKLVSNGYFLNGGNITHPILYYVALGVVILGFFLTGIGILGCWASCLHSYCFLISYVLLIMILLIGECAVFTVMWIWPNCLGFEMKTNDLIQNLKINYGTAGNEQLTVALDLAQTKFGCCGIVNYDEYQTSLWHLQDLGPKLIVPLSCCVLENYNETRSYLNPRPRNKTLCQSLDRNKYYNYRHNKGCFWILEDWYMHNYFVFFMTGLLLVITEFMILLGTIIAFTRMCKYRNSSDRSVLDIPGDPEPDSNETVREIENIYHTSIPVFNRSFRQNYKINDNT